MVGFIITDPAAKMAQRLGVPFFTQRQADVMRRRVGELEASIQREADRQCEPFRAVARRRLADVVRERRRRLTGLTTSQVFAIVDPVTGVSAAAGKWGSP